MIRRTVTLPEIGLIAGTRGALGAGLGLLLANRLSPEKRSAVGWTLVTVGVLSTFPLLAQFLFGENPDAPASRESRSTSREMDLESTYTGT